MLGKLLALTGLTAAAVAGVASPASAAECQDPTSVCLITDPMTVPVGTPVVGPAGVFPMSVGGPRLCNTSTGECTETWVIVPGAYVGADGSTLASVTIPSVGFEIDRNRVVTVYYGTPGVDPSSSGPPEVTLMVWLAPVPLATSDTQCTALDPLNVGPVATSGSTCFLHVTVTT